MSIDKTWLISYFLQEFKAAEKLYEKFAFKDHLIVLPKECLYNADGLLTWIADSEK